MIFNDDNDALTPNAISKLVKPTFYHVTNLTPTCQVLNVEKLSMKTGPNRYKIILSDGTHCVEAILAHKANWIATKLDSNDIVEIVGYNTVTTNTDNVIMIQDLVIKQAHLKIVGAPTPLVPTEETNKAEEDEDGLDDNTSPTPTATYIDQQHPIIDDWTILSNGSIHGILRDDITVSDKISEGTTSTCTIVTSTPASFCCPDSLTIDYDSNFDSIDDLNCLVTITGSCYQLGLKNDSHQWDDCFQIYTKNLTELSNSANDFRTGTVNVGDYVSHVFTGTLVGFQKNYGKDKMLVELDMDAEFGSGFLKGDCMVGLDSLTYTQSRNLYRTLHPNTVPNMCGPHVTGERVALILFGQLTEKGLTEDREEYCGISFDDYFSYPIEAQFPTEEASLMEDLFSKLQHVTVEAMNGRQVNLRGSIGHMAERFPPIAIGHMVEPVPPPVLDAPVKRQLFQETTTIEDKSKHQCLRKKKKL
jgi:hypothetical protein